MTCENLPYGSVERVIGMYFRRLADTRVDKDLKQKEVAAILEMSPEVYRRYEKGLREIPVWALIKVAVDYQTSTAYLLGRTDVAAAPRA